MASPLVQLVQQGYESWNSGDRGWVLEHMSEHPTPTRSEVCCLHDALLAFKTKDASGTAPLTVVQWLRFGGGAYMQMIGIARTDAWKDAYPRFRTVRDGIEPK